MARTDIQVRDFALKQLQIQNTELKSSLDQVLTSTSQTLSLHVSLLEQQAQLHARLKVCSSAVQHYRNQLLEYRTTTGDQLQEIQAKYDKIAAQVSEEDSILKALAELSDAYYLCQSGQNSYAIYYKDDLRRLRPYLWPDDEEDT